MIVIRIDTKTAIILVVGLAVLILNTTQAIGLVADMWPLIRSIHFNLVQAPLEAAVNSARSALEDSSGTGE